MSAIPRPTEPRYWRMLKFVFQPVAYLEDYGRKFGDCWAIGREETPLVYIHHPEAIRAIFTADKEMFDSGRGNSGILSFLLGQNSLVLLDGQTHQRQRKLLMPPFHGEKLKTYGDLIVDITEKVTVEWQEGQLIPLRHYTQEITLRVILQAVFGLCTGARYDELRHLLAGLLDTTSSPLSSSLLFFQFLQKDWGNWSPWGRFLRTKQRIDDLLYAEIAERRLNKFDGNDILTLLLAARDEDGNPMTDEELHDELMTLLVAGHETTASALSWALYWIHYLPEVGAKLRQELASLGDFPDPLEIVKLPYLSAVCWETLRIYPIALTTFPRLLKAPLEVMGYHFKAGTALMPCIYLIHHREDIYPQADQFQPQRFLNRQYSPYEYFPFGGGDRRCIGMGLALMEMKLALASILDRFQLILPYPKLLRLSRRGLTVAPPSNLRLKVIQRTRQ
jgi:cytochrome P450 family 110